MTTSHTPRAVADPTVRIPTTPTIEAPTAQAPTRQALGAAARAALRAPSVFNTQPWRWLVGPGPVLTLRADTNRHLVTTDPDGRLLLISCGAALHHARVALAAAGHAAEVVRLPDPTDPDLLATITVTGRRDPTPADAALAAAIPRRRTDRRAFGDEPVPADTLRRLRAAVEAQGTSLHEVRIDQMPMLSVVTAEAARAELADPAYRAELARWTNRPPGSRDGVPAASAVPQAPRRVQVRDHAVGGTPGLPVGAGFDLGATYAVLFGRADGARDWLAAGEALSALLLTAVAHGLATAPLSDPIELDWPRRLMRDLLAGVGEPYLVVRLGIPLGDEPPPPVPRRDPADVIEYLT
ncbi:Acg family FMN-binding oxidoreductase [Rhizomonospora bruguierae]|uniref:Acg family FMN-binding oxidoreductase n=1 Tax=Rhizomonospora bruguierae TaxID=1581705 RepID=UPI001BD0C20F|nr:nitroreductase [Micromonospora sp. NBRC 107566]